MKNVIVFHGAGEDPSSVWFPFLKKNLESRGYQVSIPALPDSETFELKKWLPTALKEQFDEKTILIGHSAGCPLILSILENINLKIKQAILVAGFITNLPVDKGKDNPILQKEYDWGKIKNNCGEFIFINSVNDPWGCDDKQGRIMFDKLGGTQVINNEAHMGSETYHQPYTEFPFLLSLIP